MAHFTRDTLRDLIANNGGKFFTATFRVKDGTERTYNMRAGVRKYLVNQDNPKAPTTAHIPHYLCVYVMGKGYRTLNLDTVSRVTIGGRVVTVQSEKNLTIQRAQG